MPLTPLHFGAMAPVFHWTHSWLALVSFTIVNLWIDAAAIFAWLEGSPLPSHDEAWHTLHGALAVAMGVSLLGILSWRWVFGAFYGAVTHILLDGMVHPEMQPFFDTERGNPIYLGAMLSVSLGLLPLTIWLITLIVSDTLRRVRRYRAGSSPPPDHRSS